MKGISFLLGLFVVSVLLLTAFSSVDGQSFPYKGLVDYYPFNKSPNDESGLSGGSLTNHGAIYVADRFGDPASAAYFDGQANYMKGGNWFYMQEFTISLWINPNNTQVAFACIMDNNYSPQSSWSIRQNTNLINNYNFGGFYLDLPCSAPPPLPYFVLPSGIWSSVAIVKTAAYTSTFINGRHFYTAQGVQTPYGGLQSLTIGCSETLDRFFGGSIDEIRIYNRALTSTEVSQLFIYESTCRPHAATATATVVDGIVAGITITDNGCCYTNAPLVLLQGGGGNGATATAIISNGVVSDIIITDGGFGYTSTPSIYIYSPLGLQIGLTNSDEPFKAVIPLFVDLLLGVNYQLQIAGHMNAWKNYGTPFKATNASMTYPQHWDVDNLGQLFFRLQVAP
jgi:hypothetical protein